MTITAQTERSDFHGGLPNVGALIKVGTVANPDGSFSAAKLKSTDQSDASNSTKLNTVEFHGITTSAVGSDRIIHFRVGNKSYSFAISATTDLGDFNNNA